MERLQPRRSKPNAHRQNATDVCRAPAHANANPRSLAPCTVSRPRRRWTAGAVLACCWSGRSTSPRRNADTFAAVRQRLVADGFSAEAVAAALQPARGLRRGRRRLAVFRPQRGQAQLRPVQRPRVDREGPALPAGEHGRPERRPRQAYGVDQRVITAILLVESRLGTISGNRSAPEHPLHAGRADRPGRAGKPSGASSPPERRISRERFDERVQKRAEWGYRELKALLRYARARGHRPHDASRAPTPAPWATPSSCRPTSWPTPRTATRTAASTC
ncbi:MAG: lytic murein transglycosylase [Desulfobacterales bacterium]|nr:lytic murein transglycosylase [Desulfobacterales bacterium]